MSGHVAANCPSTKNEKNSYDYGNGLGKKKQQKDHNVKFPSKPKQIYKEKPKVPVSSFECSSTSGSKSTTGNLSYASAFVPYHSLQNGCDVVG